MTQTAPPPPRMTIADILRLGQSGRPWEFLSLGALALQEVPDNEALRFVFAANLARLGLGELAREQMGLLSEASRGHADVVALGRAAAALPPALMPAAERIGNAERAVAGLAARGVDLASALERWRGSQGGVEVFKTVDGNFIRRPAAETNARRWQGLFDGRAFAVQVCQRAVQLDPTFKRSIVFEGVDTPIMLLELAAAADRATAKTGFGYRARFVVVQRDSAEMLDGASLCDLSGFIADARSEWIVGGDAGERLRRMLDAQMTTNAAWMLVRNSWLRSKVEPDPNAMIQAQQSAATAEINRLRASIDAAYAGRDRAWWAERYAEAASGGPPLRVLVPTSRYTTVLKYVSADLVAALQRLGCEAELLMEPDDFSQLSMTHSLSVVDRLKPDLIVLANYPRSTTSGSFPANVPYITWLQDAMPHLFDAEVGRSLGDLDYLVGHLFIELFEKHEYPMERALAVSLVADDLKFHPAPVEPSLRERFACEVAMVSHQSETPEAMHDRIVAEHDHAPDIQAALRRIYPRIVAAVDDAMGYTVARRLREVCTEELGRVFGSSIPAKAMDVVYRGYAMPLGDRLMRHQTLGWAAEICDRRGWRLHLYGRGWEKHPTLARFAQGELNHGDELRAAYQCAAVQLHASSTTLVHQRIVECALSGGLCLCRLHYDALSGPRSAVQRVLINRKHDAVRDDGWLGWTIADHAEAMALASAMSAVGASYPDGYIWLPPNRIANLKRQAALHSEDHDATSLLGDLAEATFADHAGLEMTLGRAVNDEAWRGAVAAMIAGRARARFTHTALAGRMLALVSDDLLGQRAAERSIAGTVAGAAA